MTRLSRLARAQRAARARRAARMRRWDALDPVARARRRDDAALHGVIAEIARDQWREERRAQETP